MNQLNQPDKSKVVTFYLVVGVGAVQVGRVALFGHTVVGRALSIACLILMALLTREVIGWQRGGKK